MILLGLGRESGWIQASLQDRQTKKQAKGRAVLEAADSLFGVL